MCWKIDELLKRELGLSIVKNAGVGVRGAINEGHAFDTDQGRIFVKYNSESKARLMFDGELASLEALIATECVHVPKPLKVIDAPERGAFLVMECVDLSKSLSSHGVKLGEQIARLHLQNSEIRKQAKKQESSVHKSSTLKYVDKFGFDVQTCCGYIPQENSWTEDWVKFYARKIETQMKLIDEHYGDREVRDLWSQLLPILPQFFTGLEIEPALLHGDLWGGNVAENKEGPVIFDPASFYGHAHFDLSISSLFGGFPKSFFSSYYNLIPQEPGHMRRMDLYNFFHYINHWNHFGTGYRSSTISTLRSLLK